jgi:ERCC4-type nuclease
VIHIAPSEPGQLVSLGVSSSIPEQYGADILIVTESGVIIGIQRKTFPADYLSSRDDGRLATSLTKLTQCDERLLVLEGQPRWTTSGQLIANFGGTTFMRAHLRSQLFTASIEYGITPHWTDDVLDTADLIHDLVRWFDKPRHDSLASRPGPFLGPLRRKFTDRDMAVHILQGCDGIGPELAGRIYDHFGGLPLAWTVSDEALMEVSGMGPERVRRVTKFIKSKELSDA